mgnify:FL=1
MYRRYYKMSKEDFDIYKKEKDVFYEKYKNELNQNGDCFTENFIGSGALRDYDGANRFQDAYKSAEINPWQGYLYHEGVLYARIIWEHKEIYVPPVQIKHMKNGESERPLEKNCELIINKKIQPICYSLKDIYFKNPH